MKPVSFESPVVHSYLGILQNVISRMAAGSGSCKTWCITLVSAIVVVVATQGTPNCVWLALIPVLLFLFLDSYYLSLERTFRRTYNEFIRKLLAETAVSEDTFIVRPLSNWTEIAFPIFKGLESFSVWSFYGMLVLVLVLARYLILTG